MNDSQKVAIHCQARQDAGEEISDACARVIAASWYSSNAGASFATTGAITVSPSALWRELFLPEYESGRMSAGDRLAADMLGTYLTAAGERGPVAGWSGLWL